MKAIGKASGMAGRGGRAGFTLIELLVVIGIVVVLVGILVPVIRSAQMKARKTAVASDLQVIGQALSEYNRDFAGYPRHRLFTAAEPRQPGDSGPAVLAWALLSPYDVGTANALTPGPFDGANGAGFRDRTTGQGPVHGPYLKPDKFKTKEYELQYFVSDNSGVSALVMGKFKYILDSEGNPIMYFPAKPGRTNIAKNPSGTAVKEQIKPGFPKSQAIVGVSSDSFDVRRNYVSYDKTPATAAADKGDYGLYNMDDSYAILEDISGEQPRFRQSPADPLYLGGATSTRQTVATLNKDKVRAQIQYRLEQAGDYQGPYLLWSSGADGWFFTDDDATNFSVNSSK